MSYREQLMMLSTIYGGKGVYLCDEDDGYCWPPFFRLYIKEDCDKMEGKWRRRGKEVQVQAAI